MCKTEKQNARKKKVAFKEPIKDPNRWSIGYKLLISLLALISGYLNHHHVATLFENDRHFSHLSNLEREMTFRTEMGMYYSYYKTLVTADTFTDGLYALYRNNKTEYPDTINTLKRFNLYPEVVIGALYRMANQSGFISQECWKVERGQGMAPVYSCEGLQDPPHFYLAGVWLCAGLTTFVLFILGTVISESLLGGVIATTCFFFNHGESTRVMWTPPLRESFAFPICLLQVLSVSCALNCVRTGWKNLLSISITTLAFILCWQFAQFMLFTQVCAVYMLYVCRVISKDVLASFNISVLIGLLHAVALMFGNEMLFSSMLFASLSASILISLLFDAPLSALPSLVKITFQIFLFGVISVGIKIGLSKAMMLQDDAHVLEIFKSKFTDFKSFNTQLYNCAKEFDFLGWETPVILTKTLLLPAACLSVLLSVYPVLVLLKNMVTSNLQNVELPKPGVCYNIIQTGAYAIMAVLIMRLKLFLTPHLCILAAILAAPRLAATFRGREYQIAFIVALVAAMSYQGIHNIGEQRKIMGEYSDPELEELFDWVAENTDDQSVFAGSMPLMANLMLSTGRPVVNHPHFEDIGSRARTKSVYTIFSRKPQEQVFQILKNMQVDYVVISQGWCLSVSRDGCAMPQLWDLEDKENAHYPPVCPILWKNPRPFVLVFKNPVYMVLQIPKKVVEIKEAPKIKI